MKLCFFDDDRFGVFADGHVFDVTRVLDRLPTYTVERIGTVQIIVRAA